MTRLDQNRGRAQIAERLKVNVGQVANVIIWGNHSATQVPDANNATVDLGSGPVPVPEALKNDEWLKGEFITVSRYKFVCSIIAWMFRNLIIPSILYRHETPLGFTHDFPWSQCLTLVISSHFIIHISTRLKL
jgi:hypothetical protein